MSTLTVQSSDGRLILEVPLPAKALFSFNGESNYGELTYNKDDAILIFCEDMTEGWSLGMLVDGNTGEERILADSTLLTRGLIARGFYEYVPADGDQAVSVTTSESPKPQIVIQPPDVEEADAVSTTSVDALGIAIQHATLPTDEESKVANEEAGSNQQAKVSLNSEDDCTAPEKKPEAILPIQVGDVLQRPPERRTRQASLNPTRPHNAVEAYLFSSIDKSQGEQHKEGDLAQIIDGQWMETSAVSHLSISSYSHRSSTSKESEYTAYEITCTTSSAERPEGVPRDASSGELTVKHNCVHRRYNHFQHLDTILRLSYPLISIPALPEKKLTGRFTQEFLNARRRDLERYLRRIIRHPLLRSHEAMLDFLTNDDEELYQRALHRRLLRATAVDPYRFFEKVDHDGNCFDISDLLDESNEEVDDFASHVEAVEKGQGISAIKDGLAEYRISTQNTGTAVQALSHSLYKLIAGLARSSELPRFAEGTDLPLDSLQRSRYLAKAHRMQNNEGAFCWKEDCKTCLSTTKAIQEAAGAFNAIAGLYEANAQTVLLAPMESLAEIDVPNQRHKALVDMHRSTQGHLEEYLKQREAGEQADDALEAKFETVLAAISAEIDQVHQQRQADLRKTTQTILDGQIAFHERALAQLRNARSLYDEPRHSQLAEEGLRLPPRFEKSALTPLAPQVPLREPSTYGAPGPSHSPHGQANILGSLLAGGSGSLFSWRSASSAIRAQNGDQTGKEDEDAARRLTSPSMAAANKFVQFLDWTTNSRGEQRKYVA